MKKMLVMLLCVSGLTMVGQRLQPIQSPFNSLTVDDSLLGNYSFIVTGHFYGNRFNKTGYPTNTVYANLDWINESKTNFMVTLGDLFMDVSHDIPLYQKSFFSKLKKPLFNSVGNHDLTGDIYQKNFGRTFYYFIIDNDIHVVVDTEKDNGDFQGDQLKMLEEVAEVAETNGEIKNVFVYSHRTCWVRSYKELDHMFTNNTQSKLGNNFQKEVLPLITSLAKKVKVFWFSGSMGGGPASFFYYPQGNITYITSAIRGLPRDAVLIVNVHDGEVSFDTHSFTANKTTKLEDYNLDYWNENMNKPVPFNYRLIPLYIKQMFFHIYFWIGIVLSLVLVGMWSLVKKRFKNK